MRDLPYGAKHLRQRVQASATAQLQEFQDGGAQGSQGRH